MSSQPCDACGDRVPIAGGIAGIFQTDPEPTGGMTLELADGSEHFLCFACIDELPDEPDAADVAAIERP